MSFLAFLPFHRPKQLPQGNPIFLFHTFFFFVCFIYLFFLSALQELGLLEKHALLMPVTFLLWPFLDIFTFWHLQLGLSLKVFGIYFIFIFFPSMYISLLYQ